MLNGLCLPAPQSPFHRTIRSQSKTIMGRAANKLVMVLSKGWIAEYGCVGKDCVSAAFVLMLKAV